MSKVTRMIGLSLGADLCWPICFEEILKRLDLTLRIGSDEVRFESKRVRIKPFDLNQGCEFDVVLDRLTHWYHTSREWIKKAVIMDGLYVFNNPWSLQSMEKHTAYCAMMRLGLPVPATWLVPPKEYEPSPDLEVTLARYASIFDLGDIGAAVGYPLFMKPYDGGAWVGVSRIENATELKEAYDSSGTRVMHLQKAVDPFDLFVRCVGVGPQVNPIRYDPTAPLHDRYKVEFNFLNEDDWSLVRDMTLTINSFFGWDFNSCESLHQEGTYYPIDFANACPDSQVTSLHFHFPWLIKAKLRWAIFCAATKRPMRQNLDWEPFFKIADQQLPYRESLRRYAAIAMDRFENSRFEDFCREHLSHLDEVSWEFFGGDRAHEAVQLKVESLFPEHEVERFSEHFWGLIQFWRKTERERLDHATDSDNSK